MASGTLADSFQNYFGPELARTATTLEQVFRLRYKVFCEENGFWRDKHPDGLERDHLDGQSLHCLLVHKPTETPAGCVRMVRARHDDPNDMLQFEALCGEMIVGTGYDPAGLSREELCEVSRLAVPHTFRKRREDQALGDPGPLPERLSEEERRTFPLLGASLFLSATAMVEMTGRRHVFAVMEEKLARLLYRAGMEFRQAGEFFEHLGTRAPYYIDVRDALQGMKPELRRLYDAIHADMEIYIASGDRLPPDVGRNC